MKYLFISLLSTFLTAVAGAQAGGPGFTCVSAKNIPAKFLAMYQSELETLSPDALLPCPVGYVPKPVERYGRKGRTPVSLKYQNKGNAKTQALTNASGTGGYYFYAGAYQQYLPNATGASALFSQHDPYLAKKDDHSLAEVAVEASGGQIVEIGWIVDDNLFGDTLSHLFVFHWVNGNATCYNGCGYVQLSSSVYPGAVVQPNTTATYEIYNYNGNWILNYNGTNIGYFPGSIWNNGFNTSNFIQWFGEVDAATTNPCTDMGSSVFGTAASGAAAMIDLTLIFGANLMQAALNGVTQTNTNFYNVGNLAPKTFTYGGPGGC